MKRCVRELEIKTENALGFHIPGIFDKVLNITECHLQPEPTNLIRNAVHEYSRIKDLSYFDIKGQSRLFEKSDYQEFS